jgi:hypothetical protein
MGYAKKRRSKKHHAQRMSEKRLRREKREKGSPCPK